MRAQSEAKEKTNVTARTHSLADLLAFAIEEGKRRGDGKRARKIVEEGIERRRK